MWNKASWFNWYRWAVIRVAALIVEKDNWLYSVKQYVYPGQDKASWWQLGCSSNGKLVADKFIKYT